MTFQEINNLEFIHKKYLYKRKDLKNKTIN